MGIDRNLSGILQLFASQKFWFPISWSPISCNPSQICRRSQSWLAQGCHHTQCATIASNSHGQSVGQWTGAHCWARGPSGWWTRNWQDPWSCWASLGWDLQVHGWQQGHVWGNPSQAIHGMPHATVKCNTSLQPTKSERPELLDQTYSRHSSGAQATKKDTSKIADFVTLLFFLKSCYGIAPCPQRLICKIKVNHP